MATALSIINYLFATGILLALLFGFFLPQSVLAAPGWTTVMPRSTARNRHTATLLPNGKVLVVGNGPNSAEIYDPQADT